MLFEPVAIGPVTAPNRFCQVPHCNGMGHRNPRKLAAMRGIKAEGGWGIVCTEEVEIHPSAEISPAIEGRLWDDDDVAYHRLTTEAVHAHGALAGIELVYNGFHAPNHETRLPPMAPSARPVDSIHPVHARAMDRSDIRDLRRWHVDAARRAADAGYDIVYAYAGHGMSILMHFLQRRNNQRSDDYGGSLDNRVRIVREIISDMKDAVGDRCAIAFRLAVDELRGKDGIAADGEARDIVGMIADLPDLWDVNVSDWANDSATARFAPDEGYQDDHTRFVKALTDKPVCGVGRYTSPDGMVARIRRGHLDLIGAARPSIADPFLPNKVREGRVDEIRECIGCNICVSGDNIGAPIRCTQNPTMGEEWRRGWHPERIEVKTLDGAALVVGGGPSGLECALQLARRGHRVTLAEASGELGGRLLGEASLPGFSSYFRVRDHRAHFLRQDANVAIYFDSRLDAATVLEMGARHVFLATGSRWRRDGAGRTRERGLTAMPDRVMTPDDILEGHEIGGRVVIYDDDHYYMGGALAELLSATCAVTLVTPAPVPSAWTDYTLEQDRIHRRLIECGVELVVGHAVVTGEGDRIEAACVVSGHRRALPCDVLVPVTARDPVAALHADLTAQGEGVERAGIETVERIGDCLAPGTVASAVYLGHLAARNLGGADWTEALYRRERVDLDHSREQ